MALAAAQEVLSKQSQVENKATETDPPELESELHSLRSSHQAVLVELASLQNAATRVEKEAEQKTQHLRKELEVERQHSRLVFIIEIMNKPL